MRIPTAADVSNIVEAATRLRERLASMDAGKVATRTVGGAIVLTASFLVVANPHATPTPDPSAVVASRIAPVGTVQLGEPIIVAAVE
ncbi:hypothetical protein [Thiocapsa marina]|uniref:Uncharacterized protein n=1 Tax=Thiocapsa marina 5811 TaxID=768671 RepID=F9UEF2_9GAMM|nr:hypothetical protein [Thiocapsa marina]EGV17273.1 hypothetical protein ThimaDRAFT_3305 [Thiocapsa marina 5811]